MPPRNFLTLSCCSTGSHEACWTWIKKTGRKVWAHLIIRFNRFWAWQQSCTCWGGNHERICSRPRNDSSTTEVLFIDNFHRKMLVLLTFFSAKLLAKWQEPFMVTGWVGDVDYEVVRSDRGGATQIYHLNLLKAWKEAKTNSLVSLVKERWVGGRGAKFNHSHLPPHLGGTCAVLDYLWPMKSDVFSKCFFYFF